MTCYPWGGGRPCFPAESFLAPLTWIRTSGTAPHINGAGTVTHYSTESFTSAFAPDRTRWLIPADDLCYPDTGTSATVTVNLLWTPYASWFGGVFPDDPGAPNRDIAEVGFISLFIEGVTTIATATLRLERATANLGVERQDDYLLDVPPSWYTSFKTYLALGRLAIAVTMNLNGMQRPVDPAPASYENGYVLSALWTDCGGLLPPLRNSQRDDLRNNQRTSRQLSIRNAAYL